MIWVGAINDGDGLNHFIAGTKKEVKEFFERDEDAVEVFDKSKWELKMNEFIIKKEFDFWSGA